MSEKCSKNVEGSHTKKGSLKENLKDKEERKEKRAEKKRHEVPDFSNSSEHSKSSMRHVSKNVPEFSKSLADSIGHVKPASKKVPEFSNNLVGNSGPLTRPASPVFSIVTIKWPTAVDNFYEDVENPYGLTRSNSFRLV